MSGGLEPDTLPAGGRAILLKINVQNPDELGVLLFLPLHTAPTLRFARLVT